MPWNGSYGFGFTDDSIAANAPASSGLYALFTEKAWIYIGEADDIQRALREHKALIEHLSEPEAWAWRYPKLAFGFWGMPAPERFETWKSLLEEFKPACNATFVPSSPFAP